MSLKRAAQTAANDKPMKLAEQWKGRADDAGRLARAVLNEHTIDADAPRRLFYGLDVEELLTVAWKSKDYDSLPKDVRDSLLRVAIATLA